jgi:pSer/pThr/pTyr-binding forkhead associated (FHA) protein
LGQFQAPRKVLIIASDGKFEDTAFRHNQVAQEANRLNVRIVTIGYYERQNDVKDLQSLRRLSADTRGFFFDTPGPQRALTPKDRADFIARLMAGVILEAEAQVRGVPNALQISLRHPQGATTSFAALLMPGVAGPDTFAQDPAVPMNADGDVLNRLYQFYSWLAEDRSRIVAVLIVVAILLIAFVITGAVRSASRRNSQSLSAPVPEQPAPRIVPEDPPTIAKPEQSAAPVKAPATVIRAPATIAWLEFNGEPGRVAVRKERIAIGRERDNDVVTDAQELTVSRYHAVLSVGANGSFQIINRTKEYREDPNPILINGVPKESGEVADGDVIKLGTGNYGFLFRDARGTSVPGNRLNFSDRDEQT